MNMQIVFMMMIQDIGNSLTMIVQILTGMLLLQATALLYRVGAFKALYRVVSYLPRKLYERIRFPEARFEWDCCTCYACVPQYDGECTCGCRCDCHEPYWPEEEE